MSAGAPGRRGVYRLALVSSGLGLLWGVATYGVLTTWRTLPIVSDNGWGTALVWLAGLIGLLALLERGSSPLAAAGAGAAFWVAAVVGYYGTYVVLVLPGVGLDIGQPSTWRGLWFLLKDSVAQWLVLGGVGGFLGGWSWGQVARRVRRRRA